MHLDESKSCSDDDRRISTGVVRLVTRGQTGRFLVLTLTFRRFNINQKLTFTTRRSTPTYFFGTGPRLPKETLKSVPNLPHHSEKCFCHQQVNSITSHAPHTRAWGCQQQEYLCGSLRVHVVSTQTRVNSC